MKDILLAINKMLCSIGATAIGITMILTYSTYGALPTEVLELGLAGVLGVLGYMHSKNKEHKDGKHTICKH